MNLEYGSPALGTLRLNFGLTPGPCCQLTTLFTAVWSFTENPPKPHASFTPVSTRFRTVRRDARGLVVFRFRRIGCSGPAENVGGAQWFCWMMETGRRLGVCPLMGGRPGWGGRDWLESYLAAAIGRDGQCAFARWRQRMKWTMSRS